MQILFSTTHSRSELEERLGDTQSPGPANTPQSRELIKKIEDGLGGEMQVFFGRTAEQSNPVQQS